MRTRKTSFLSFLLLVLCSPTLAEELVIEVEQVPGEAGLIYASACCAPDFFFPVEGYLPVNNCAVNTSNTCVLNRSVACWLYPIPELGPDDTLVSVKFDGERTSKELSGTGVLQLKFTSSAVLTSQVLFDIVNDPDRVDTISWGIFPGFSFNLFTSTFAAFSEFSYVAILAYKPSIVPNYILNFPDEGPVLEFVIDVQEPKPKPCPQDLNNSGFVDGGDLTQVLGSWGLVIDPPGSGPDITGDGLVTGMDLAQILSFWGPCR